MLCINVLYDNRYQHTIRPELNYIQLYQNAYHFHKVCCTSIDIPADTPVLDPSLDCTVVLILSCDVRKEQWSKVDNPKIFTTCRPDGYHLACRKYKQCRLLALNIAICTK